MEYLLCGAKTSMREIRSRQVGLALGYSLLNSCFGFLGKFLMYLLALSLPMKAMSSSVGVPKVLTTRCTWSS
jgi:hypothetical protein